MKDTTTAPALPDAIERALSRYESAVFNNGVLAGNGDLTDDECADEASDMDGLRDAIRDAIAAADAAGEARGRAAMLAEVDAACSALAPRHIDNAVVLAVYADEWIAQEYTGVEGSGPTPTAAILAAAAALGGDA